MENLYFKLQTLPEYSEKGLELYYKKYKESNNLSSLEEAKVDFYNSAGKNPLFGSIHSITVGYIQEGIIRVKVLRGSEKDVITEFLNITNNKFFSSYQMCSWNFAFILPFLRIRAKKNKIESSFHKDIVDLSKKAWTISGLDLFDSWKGLGWFSSSLEEVAELTFGITTNFVDGEDVYKYYQAAKIDELDQSSINEMITLINVHRGIKGEDFIQESNADISLIGNVEVVEQPLLVKLYNDKQFNEKVKEELRAKKILKKDKPTVEKLVLASYLEIVDVMAQNKKELNQINEQRTEEIKEFFKTL